MTLNIELVEQETQTVMYIRTRTSFADMPKLIGESYCKIAAYLGELGEQPAGMPYAAYYNLDMQDMDLEMGFPVAKQLPGIFRFNRNSPRESTLQPANYGRHSEDISDRKSVV